MMPLPSRLGPSASGSGPARSDFEQASLRLHRPPQFEHPLSLVYRCNPTFDRLLPLVERDLTERGYAVQRYPLPSSLDERAMASVLAEAREELTSSIRITDNTTKLLVPRGIKESIPGGGSTLDGILFSATFEVVAEADSGGVLGGYREMISHAEDSARFKLFLDTALGAMSTVLARALKSHPVDFIGIFAAHLSEHVPFCCGPEELDAGAVLEKMFRDMQFKGHISIFRDPASWDLGPLIESQCAVCLGDRHLLTTKTLEQGIERLARSFIPDTTPRKGSSNVVGDGQGRLRSGRHRETKALLNQVALVEEASGLVKEWFGLRPPVIDDDLVQGKRYWLRLPLEELYGSVFEQGLVKPGEFENTPRLVDAICCGIISSLPRSNPTNLRSI
jgi:hypothetical protein